MLYKINYDTNLAFKLEQQFINLMMTETLYNIGFDKKIKGGIFKFKLSNYLQMNMSLNVFYKHFNCEIGL